MRRILRTLLIWLGSVVCLWAHDPGLSTTQIELGPKGLQAAVGMSPADLRLLLPGVDMPTTATWTASEFEKVRPNLTRLSSELLQATDNLGNLPWEHESVSLASGNSIIFKLSTARGAVKWLRIDSALVRRLPSGHRNYVAISGANGTVLLEKLVGVKDPPVSIDLPGDAGAAAQATEPGRGGAPTFWGFLRLGIMHIWTGYDHLLFLFGLLLVCRRLRSIVGIISCFTIAHSITLALSTLRIVSIPSSIVEPLIAASILFVGFENLRLRGAEPRGRWALTFAFGLIHGFGFASALRELGVGSDGRGIAVPLLTFNLGVEIGQVTIALIVLPILWRLRRSERFVRRGVPVLSVLVALAGLYWLLERTVLA